VTGKHGKPIDKKFRIHFEETWPIINGEKKKPKKQKMTQELSSRSIKIAQLAFQSKATTWNTVRREERSSLTAK
jgi:hypothetical protein